MTNNQTLNHLNTPQIYQVKIDSHIDERWTSWFDGMNITADDCGNTVLIGTVRDQAELQGLINKIYRLGLPLISVNPKSNKEVKTEGKHDEPQKEH